MNQPPELSYREHETLKFISKYIDEHNGKPPHRNNKWFEHQSGYSWASNDITNIKAVLRNRGYIDKYTRLTEKGKRYIHWHFGDFSVQASEIRVQGKVHASPTDTTVVATIAELENPSENILTIPNVSRHSNSFALQVEGESMMARGIFPGDYVIVEKQESLWRPEAQDIIVTYYLPHDPNRTYEESIPSHNEYVGPVIKIYRPKVGRPQHELGWGKCNDQNPYSIEADDIKPVGKVVGVYRDYRSPIAKMFNA